MKLSMPVMFGIATAVAVLSGTLTSQAQDTAQAPAPVTAGRLTDPAPNLPRGTNLPPNWLADDQFMRWPYPPGDVAYNDLDGFRIKGHINEITAISRKSRDDGNQYWGRIAGTPYDKMTTDWVAAQFTRIGLEQVRIQEFDLPPQWFPTSWEVTASGGGKTVPLKTAFPLFNSVATNGSVELEPIWLGMGTAADFAGPQRQGQGRRPVRLPQPRRPRQHRADARRREARRRSRRRRGDDHRSAFPGNVMNEPQAGGTTAPAKVPVFMIGNQDGTRHPPDDRAQASRRSSASGSRWKREPG